jgi:hypothetical protein
MFESLYPFIYICFATFVTGFNEALDIFVDAPIIVWYLVDIFFFWLALIFYLVVLLQFWHDFCEAYV